jgi:O-antigen/teichoic acid export membrane protein
MEDKQLMNGLIKSIGKDTIFYIPGQIIPALLGFIGLSIYTRVYSPTDYGNYALVTATVSLLSVFSYIWLNNSNLRFYAVYKDKNELRRYFSTTFITLVVSIIAILLIFIMLVGLSVVSGVLSDFTLVIFGLVISTALTETLITILRTDRKVKFISFARSFSAISNIIITMVLIFIFHAGIISILIGQLIGDGSISIIIFFWFKFYRQISLKYFSKDSLKEFLSYGIPFLIVYSSLWVLSLSNRYIIEFFKGDYDVGIYSAASQLGTYPIMLIASMLGLAAFPVVINNWEKNGEDSTKTLISNVIRYNFIITIPMFFGLFMLSKDFTLFLGAKYATGSDIIPWVSLGTICSVLMIYTCMGLQLKKKTSLMSAFVAFAAIANIVFNLILVPPYGFYGSAVAYALAQLCYLVVTWAVSQRYLAVPFPASTFVKCLIASAVMCLSILLGKMLIFKTESLVGLMIFVIMGAVLYFVSLVILRELKQEMSFVKEFMAAGSARIKNKVPNNPK